MVLTLIVVLSTQSAFAQDSAYVSNEYAKALAVYTRAQKYNDAALTKQALVELSVLVPEDTAILRTLAELYFNNRQFVSSAMVAIDMMTLYPDYLIAQEIAALSYENLRIYDKAIEQYEKMWLQTENVTVLYQISYLQFSLKRYGEAVSNLDILFSKLTDEDKISLNKSDGTPQEVAFKAAVFNLRGLIAKEQGNNDAAKGHFSSAIQLSPEFEAAKNSLDELNKG